MGGWEFLIPHSSFLIRSLLSSALFERGVSMRKRLLALMVLAAIALPAAAIDDMYFNSLSYRLVGPFRGGRVTAVAGVPGDPMTYYMGSTGGGVWKTVDAGTTWHNVSDTVRELETRTEPEIMGEVDPALAEVGLVTGPPGDVLGGRRAGDGIVLGVVGPVHRAADAAEHDQQEAQGRRGDDCLEGPGEGAGAALPVGGGAGPGHQALSRRRGARSFDRFLAISA